RKKTPKPDVPRPEPPAPAKVAKPGLNPLQRRRLVLAVTLGVAVAFFGRPLWTVVRPQAKTTPGAYAGYNLLIVTIDTLRADHLPAYGYRGVQTPTLDGLAAESFVFKTAISHVPLTMPAHTS